MALFKCGGQMWRQVVLDTPIIINNTTSEVPYIFDHYVRNITFEYTISGRVVSGTLAGQLQIGIGGTWTIVVGNTENTSITSSGTHTITDNQKHKVIYTQPWAADTGAVAACTITSSTIKIVSYEEYK